MDVNTDVWRTFLENVGNSSNLKDHEKLLPKMVEVTLMFAHDIFTHLSTAVKNTFGQDTSKSDQNISVGASKFF